MKQQIYRRDGATKVTLEAVQNSDGSLTISGCDLGQAPLKAYGESELEYDLTIPASSVPKVMAALLRVVLAPSETPITTLRQILDTERIPHRFRVLP